MDITTETRATPAAVDSSSRMGRTRSSAIHVGLAPDQERRLVLLTRWTKSLERNAALKLSVVAARTRGLTGAELRRVVELAREFASELGTRGLEEHHFSYALSALELRAGERLTFTDRELEVLAYHEAGQMLIGRLEPGAPRVSRASVFPGTQRREAPALSPAAKSRLSGEAARRAHLTGLVAGTAALRLVYGSDAPELDLVPSPEDRALGPARSYVARRLQPSRLAVQRIVPVMDGDSLTVAGALPSRTDEAVKLESRRILAECVDRAERILGSHRRELDRLAHRLVAAETLSAHELNVVDTGHGSARRRDDHRQVRSPSWRRWRASLSNATETPVLPWLRDTGLPPARIARPSAPRALDAEKARHRSEPVMSVVDRLRYWGVAAVWMAANVSLWGWWLAAGHRVTPWLFWIQTVMLFYQVTLLPTFYWGFVGRMRRPIEMSAPAGVKVALITLCVPSHESMGVIAAQLDALAAVRYPHDSWILDEGASWEVRDLAHARGVRYFTRQGVGSWNEPGPPFQQSTKAGNVNAWLDHVASLGLDYEAFVQFDIDHLPRPQYLDRTLGYLRDPQVAWVQAPSVYGNTSNWASRGLTELDLVFHGPLQMGFYGHSSAPFIIGSHTTYRTSAIRAIGGFQPTRAEDHLDTVVLAAHGYRGVFVPEIIAVGDGPTDLSTFLRQQFAWAHSMIQIFLHHTPRLLRLYSPRQALQFLFCQSWYAFWSISLAVLWALPVVALLAGRPIAPVRPSLFFVYFLPVILGASLMWSESRRWFLPGNVRLSWRGVLLGVARWPVVLWALINVVLRIPRTYMITPKGKEGARPPSSSLYGPTLAIAGVPLAAIWLAVLSGSVTSMWGYVWLAILNAVMGLAVVLITIGLELRNVAADAGWLGAARVRAGAGAITAGLLAGLVITVVVQFPSLIGVLS